MKTPRAGWRLPVLVGGLAAALAAGPPGPAAAAGEGVGTLARAVLRLAPNALPVPGGWRFRTEGVVVSVLADDAAGLLRVVARAGDLSDRDIRLVASALGPDLPPDRGARLVSVRGLVCSAVLAPLRGLGERGLSQAIAGAVQGARSAAGAGVAGPAPGPAGALAPPGDTTRLDATGPR